MLLPVQQPIVKYEPEDSRRTVLTAGLTPPKAGSLVQAADGGDIGLVLQLFQEMEEKDLRLHSVLSTRRMALTRLPWEIVSAEESERFRGDKALANEAAAFAFDMLSELDDFAAALPTMADAIGPNLAVLENVWEGSRLVAINPVLGDRLRFNYEKSKQLHITTREFPATGIPASLPYFVAHMPKSRHGYPLRGTLVRAVAMIFLVRNYALKDWATFSEVFGMPVRIGRYEPGAKGTEKREMLDMLRLLGTDAVALFSKSMDLEFKEAGDRSGAPYESIMDWASRELAVGILGQNLTTDTTGGTGTFAAADVQDRVREDLCEDDATAEARTIRRQILEPVTRIWFGRHDAPVPIFRRKAREVIDHIQEADKIERGLRIGLKIPRGYAYERMGIPVPPDVDPNEFLDKPSEPSSPIGGLFAGVNQ